MRHVSIRVLVVEDDPELRDMMIEALETAGMTTRGAASLAEARAELREARVDVVTLDLGLEDGSGVELARELRRTHVRVLAITGRTEQEIQDEAFQAGCVSVLVKPVWPADLVLAVRVVAGRG